MKSGACKGLLRKRGLLQSVTQAEFGLALCDDDGAGLEIDGVVVEAVPAHGECAHTAVDAPQPDYRTNTAPTQNS